MRLGHLPVQAWKGLFSHVHKSFLCACTAGGFILQKCLFMLTVQKKKNQTKSKKKKKAALVRVQIGCHLFSKNFRHWHRFPIVSHLSSYLSHSFRNNHIPQQGMQGQLPGLVLESLRAWAQTARQRLWQPPTCSQGLSYEQIASDLRRRLRKHSWQKNSGVSCVPSSHFPHSTIKNCSGFVRNWLTCSYQAPTAGQNTSSNPRLQKADKVDPYHKSSSTDAAFPSQEGWTVYVQAAARGWA